MFKTTVVFIALATCSLAAADTPLAVYKLAPSPPSKTVNGKPSLKPDNLLRMAPPTIDVTRAVRLPDGSIQLQCVSQVNPKSELSRLLLPALRPAGER